MLSTIEHLEIGMGITSSKDKHIPEETKKDNTAPTAGGETSASSGAAKVGKEKTILRGQAYQAVQLIAKKLELMAPKEVPAFQSLSREQFGLFYNKPDEKQRATVTSRLLLAVAYGMESVDANKPVKKRDAGDLFKHNLYAKELLEKSPEYLLARGDVTDWAGRTFKNITAFEYAVWANDFKMIEMMLGCIPKTPEGDEVRKELLRQYEQVTSPRFEGGGLTYTQTYLRPNVDAKGIPIKDAAGNWDCEKVTVERWENHFDLTPLIEAYEDYERNFDARTCPERNACWVKGIGTLQYLLPTHILQRYCDPKTFYPLPPFNGEFKRSTDFCNYTINDDSSLFGSSLSSDFAIGRGGVGLRCAGGRRVDLAAVRLLDKVSTNEIKNIIGQLSQPQNDTGMRP